MKKRTISVLLILMILLSAAGGFLYFNSQKDKETKKYTIEGFDYKCFEYASMSPEMIAD